MRSCLAALALAAAVATQAPTPVDPAVVRAGEQLLRAHGERSRDLRVLVADYRQTRTTKLSQKPLVSRGQFLFVREPACIVFRARTPRVSIVRLRPSLYEVFRPEQKRLERFRLAGPELSQGLFAAIGGDAERLLREFSVQACAADPAVPERTVLVLSPRDDAMLEHLSELRLSLRTDDGALAAVAYRDRSGDLVEIALHDVVADPEHPPSGEFEVPAGTTIVEHAPPEPK